MKLLPKNLSVRSQNFNIKKIMYALLVVSLQENLLCSINSSQV